MSSTLNQNIKLLDDPYNLQLRSAVYHDNPYLDLLEAITSSNCKRPDRTGIGTLSIFGGMMRFDLSEGFPAITTKKLAWKSVVSEMLWFIEGSTDERRLAEILYQKPREELKDNKTIWTANADNQGVALGYSNNSINKELGPIYGHMMRKWTYNNSFELTQHRNEIDQLQTVINDLKRDPYSRRHIISLWNVEALPYMTLPPCPVLLQFYVENNKLSCLLYQRSCDMFLGVPFDIAGYSLLTHIIAQIVGLEVGEFIWTGGDCHIYLNHVEVVEKQILREPYDSPKLLMPKFSSLEEVLKTKPDDYVLLDYRCHEKLTGQMAI